MAIQSGRWSSFDAISNAAPEYNFGAIDRLLQEIIFREAVWAEYFVEINIRPHVITYEDFVQDPPALVKDILAFLKIETVADFKIPAPKYQRPSNALTDDWVERFRREKQSDFWTEFW